MDSIPQSLTQCAFDFDALSTTDDTILQPKTLPEKQKRCPKCETWYPLDTDHFYQRKNGKWSYRCKSCTKDDVKANYKPHPMTEEKEGARRAKQAETLRTSERARLARQQLADSRRGKPQPMANPEEFAAKISKAGKGKKHDVKPRVKFQPAETVPIHLDLPVFDGCEPRDYTEIDEVMSIYAIVNTITGKLYIGSAIDTKQRWYIHRIHLGNGEHHSAHLQSAWNKYGASAFIFRLIEIIDIADNLVIREQYWINHYHVFDPKYGYNMSPTAGSPLGVRHSEKARANMKASKQGLTITPEIRALGAKKRLQKICKLTESDVITILERLSKGESCESIAQDYPVSTSNIDAIKKGKSWKHIPRQN